MTDNARQASLEHNSNPSHMLTLNWSYIPESSESLTIFVKTAVVCSSESPTALNVSSKPRATICLK